MARQPIYDRTGAVYAYELLYRSASGPGAGQMDAVASAQALANTLIEIGLDRLAGDKLAFINVSEDLLHTDAILEAASEGARRIGAPGNPHAG